jgi:hypothetical protein
MSAPTASEWPIRFHTVEVGRSRLPSPTPQHQTSRRDLVRSALRSAFGAAFSPVSMIMGTSAAQSTTAETRVPVFGTVSAM